MKLTNLTPAWDSEVHKWLTEALELNPYQRDKLVNHEALRFSKFKVYKRMEKVKYNPLWRLTIVLFPVYLILLFSSLPIKFMVTGKWGYGDKFFDNFHAVWVRKLGL